MSKWLIIKVILWLLLGLSLQEIAVIIHKINPKTKDIFYSHLFLDKRINEPITILYYCYELAQYVDNLIRACVFFTIAKLVSFKLTQVALIFIQFYVIQVYFYIVCRNTSFLANYCLYTAIVLICIEIMLPEKKIGKYKSFY